MRTIEPGYYQHFKGGLCNVICVAKHTEREEKFVIYRLFANPNGQIDFSGTIYAMPYDMFASEVDHDKHPDVEQLWRFKRSFIQPGTVYFNPFNRLRELDELYNKIYAVPGLTAEQVLYYLSAGYKFNKAPSISLESLSRELCRETHDPDAEQES